MAIAGTGGTIDSGERRDSPGGPPTSTSAPVLDWDYPGRLTAADAELAEVLGGWSPKRRYFRRAVVEWLHPLTPTGTVRISFKVIDNDVWDQLPGQFVGIETEVEGAGYARSPYCILSAPRDDRRFELVVRVVRDGPVSRYLGSLEVGEEIAFRGPTGRSFLPKDRDHDLVLMATGVGIGPLYSTAAHLLADGFQGDIALFWGLRLVEDICLTDDLEALAARYPNFSYHITLSQPPPAWPGLCGRITESVPGALTTLGGRRYYLVGNGAMTEEMAVALSDMGVADELIHQEPYFNQKHVPDAYVLAGIRSRFVARDLFSPVAHQEAHALLFHLDTPLGASRGNADPTAPTEVGRRMPKVAERAAARSNDD